MRKDNYQVWKKEGTLNSKLKLIKDLASRSCGTERSPFSHKDIVAIETPSISAALLSHIGVLL